MARPKTITKVVVKKRGKTPKDASQITIARKKPRLKRRVVIKSTNPSKASAVRKKRKVRIKPKGFPEMAKIKVRKIKK